MSGTIRSEILFDDFKLVIVILKNLQNGKKTNFETDTRKATEEIRDPLLRRYDISKKMLAYRKGF